MQARPYDRHKAGIYIRSLVGSQISVASFEFGLITCNNLGIVCLQDAVMVWVCSQDLASLSWAVCTWHSSAEDHKT